MKAIEVVVGASLNGFLSGNLVFTIFASVVITYIWSMINGLQVIALTSLFKVNIPINVSSVLFKILQLANFDLFKVGWLLQKIFHFSETPAFNYQFATASYDNSNFILGIGMMNFAIVYYIVFLLVGCCAHKNRD